jgi:serine/threonine-protein kinase
MPIQTADDLIQALQASGLFPPEQFPALLRELDPLGDDPQDLIRHLVQTDRLTLYQVRKVIHGKAAELFVGDFVITDKLGEGGMGKVYRARPVQGGREVALKIVRSNLLNNPVVRGRYQREKNAAAALRHPNIVAVEDAGEADGRTWLVMEFVDGIDLARLVRIHGVLPVPEACEYVRQAALGLQYAHDQGFVHRDIKPSNVVVSGERHVPEAEEPASVKILDMGLVRGGFDEADGGNDLTRAGTVVGTPDYMAPEQAKNSSTVDHRADLYALGCTFYLLLTGKPPFPDGTAIEKILKHQVDPPPPLQAARPDVPEELARLIGRLMAKKPEQRFASAQELAAALEPFTRHSDPPGVVPAVAGGAADTLPPAHTVPAVSPSEPTPRPPGRPRKRAAYQPDEDVSPFEFPLEPPSGATPPLGPRSPRTTRGARSPARPQRRKSQAPLIVAVVVAAVLVVAAVVWGLVKARAAGPTGADPEPKPPIRMKNGKA